jgi:hypothetical protein
MKASTLWFGCTALMLPLHMSEQLLFGIGELAMIKHVLAAYYAWFQKPDYGTVILVAIVGTLVCALTFAILVGGIWKDISLEVWSMVAIGEAHHIIESVSAGHYTPGTATAIPYVVFGLLLLRAIIRERRSQVRSAVAAANLLLVLEAS